MKEINIKIIGLGGVGSYLAEAICRYVAYGFEDDSISITFIDGDKYEEKNKIRQHFQGGGNKAQNQRLKFEEIYKSINFKDLGEYVTEHNINSIIHENDAVFICVDNHATRKLINSFCNNMKNITVISGGNEMTDGNTQLYVKKDGVKITPSLTDYHDEVENPDDKNPHDMSCEELAKAGSPQLLFSNMTVAVYMCWMYYAVNTTENIDSIPNEVYWDGLTMNALGKVRNPKK